MLSQTQQGLWLAWCDRQGFFPEARRFIEATGLRQGVGLPDELRGLRLASRHSPLS